MTNLSQTLGCLALVIMAFPLTQCRKLNPEAPATGYGTAPTTVTSTSATSGASAPIFAPNAANATSPFGMALADFRSTSEWIATDQMVQAGPWQALECDAQPSDATGDSTELTLSAEGWPTIFPSQSCIGIRLLHNAKGVYPAGRYLIKFSGTVTWAVSGDATEVKALDKGVAAFDVATPTTAGVLLVIKRMSSQDTVRNVQVIMPGGVCGESVSNLDPFSYCATDRGGQGTCNEGLTCFDFADIQFDRFAESSDAASLAFADAVTKGQDVFFHPLFLQSLKIYRALKFVRWMPLPDTGEQPLLNAAIGQFTESRGVPWEIAVALSNLTRADPWITVGSGLSDAKVTKVATMFHDLLSSDLSTAVTYIGSFWLSGITESAYLARAESMGLAFRSGFGADASRVQLAVPIAYSDPDMTTRLSELMIGKAPFSFFTTDATFTVPPAEGTDEASLVKLFDLVKGGSTTTFEHSQLGLFVLLLGDVANQARAAGMPLIGYASGPVFQPGLIAADSRLAIRGDSRLGTTLSLSIKNWKALGGELVFITKSADDETPGVWGLRSNQTDDSSVMSETVKELLISTPCWWTGCQR